MDERGRLKATAADRSEIERPALTPHLEYRPIGDGQVLLVSETFNTLLHGKVYGDLLPLLDGSRPRESIVGALDGMHPAADVRKALAFLAAKGYVVSGDHGMDRGKAAFWSSLGASPRRAEERLGAAGVAIHGDDGRLAERLETLGVAPGSDSPALSVYVASDYLDDENDGINRHHLESGTPWILIRPRGMQPLFGPVFRPAEGSPCWACLSYRLRNNQEVHSFLRNHSGKAAAFRPTAAEPAVLDVVCGMVAVEIAKWLVLGKAAPLHDKAITLDTAGMNSEHHPVVRRPQCPACGNEAYYSTDRPATPVRLQASPKELRNSGGLRAMSPARTLEKYEHLISPVSGVVTWVARTTPRTDSWLHVHWAGSNLALRIKNLSSLRRSLRSKSAGKGSTAEQSRVSALCEAIERYSGAFHGDEIRCRRRLADFPGNGDGPAIHPNEVQLFSAWQLDHAEKINARGHPYNVVPPRFDPDRELDWSPVWSLTRDRQRYLPTAMLYGMTPEQRGTTGLWADSNGCAAGNTLEEAVLQGFYELVERDAFAIWWYNRLQRPGVDLESFGDEYLASAPGYYREYHRDMWVLDLTGDLEIPAFVALSRRTDSETEDIIYGAGAHSDPQIAALRAVCELNQCLTWVPRPGTGYTRYGVDDPMCLWWWKNGKLADNPHLAPLPNARLRRGSDYAPPETEDLRQDVEWCRGLVEARGMEFLVLDQTRPDIGMPVVRVIVPGLRHFWERFAPGRLYEVPVALGWTGHPLQESDLNPVPVIA
ncbi:MAG: TOMM precursor leader peptide-binding protein [Gammaproteobacteria bacterium]|nr:TOMM precursor leader peptide-binding protein [Gammaproteobacteria bacterium]MDE0282772.1 TOMM precursor leader peptide-binding protein [Gammaproteobacteria bacterium]MXY64362.1 TOMM precursor leader peptide-binding protein [Gammaproteobacteria bacterium]MYG68166.1 TOMM precursor leader peptide-binding protein [Gammaproteobacteria bacterium]